MASREVIHIAVIGFRGVPHVIGGIETHCEHLYPALAAAAPDLALTLIGRRRYMTHRRARLGGVRLSALPAPSYGALETLAHTPLAIAYAFLRVRASIVHLHGIGPGFFAPLARLLGMYVLVTHHAADFERPKWGVAGRAFLRAGERLAGRFANRVICVSETVRVEFLARCPAAAARAVTIRHGLAPVSPAKGDAFLREQGLTPGGYLLAVGRLEPTKRFHDLIAAHGVAGRDALPLVIVGSSIGDRHYEDALRAMAGPRVTFLGFRTGYELTTLYTHAALLLHASEMEGFGLVILEALAAGAPVAASDLPVHREFGLPEPCYFPLGDQTAIAAIVAHIGVRTEPWPAAAAIAARYNDAPAIEAHAKLYRQLASASNTAQ